MPWLLLKALTLTVINLWGGDYGFGLSIHGGILPIVRRQTRTPPRQVRINQMNALEVFQKYMRRQRELYDISEISDELFMLFLVEKDIEAALTNPPNPQTPS